MIYNTLCDEKVSGLGFGAMRLPLNEDKSINEKLVFDMVDYAMENGVNYFDTAWPYHDGLSEIVLSKALARYPRESYFLADKYPGHQVSESYNPAEIFEAQLKKCNLEYFDFYLLHNVYENSIDTYMDPKWDILNYFLKQKAEGKIKHLGFSCHARPEALKKFLKYCGNKMDFCQIQLNYLDWTLQEGKEKCELLKKYNLNIVVMEPLRGGKLANLSEEDSAKLKALRFDESSAAWSFRWLQSKNQVKVTLSGMSNLEQMIDNVKTYSSEKPLSGHEENLLFEIAESMKNSVPCTGCRYCVKECPMGIDIPTMMKLYNDIKFQAAFTVAMQMDAIPERKWPSACMSCGACASACPQKISIPEILTDFSERLSKMPKWAEICKQREEAAKKLQENKS